MRSRGSLVGRVSRQWCCMVELKVDMARTAAHGCECDHALGETRRLYVNVDFHLNVLVSMIWGFSQNVAVLVNVSGSEDAHGGYGSLLKQAEHMRKPCSTPS